MGIWDHQGLITGNGVGAKGHLPRRFGAVYAVVGKEPLAVAIHQGDERDRGFQHSRGEPHQSLKMLIAWMVKYPQAL